MSNKIISLKQADVILQAVAFIIPIILGAALQDGYLAFCAYFSVGAVQTVSAIVHRIYPQALAWHHARKNYNKLLNIIFITAGIIGVLTFISAQTNMNDATLVMVFIFLIIMLLLGIFMAVWYWYFSFRELLWLKTELLKHENSRNIIQE